MNREDLKNYIAAGITTDHECTTLEEAVEKIERGIARHEIYQWVT